jgi:hypothetical protein
VELLYAAEQQRDEDREREFLRKSMHFC